MGILLCHGRHHGGVLQNHRGMVHRDVRGDEAVPIRILQVVDQTATRKAGGPTDGGTPRHDHVLVVVADEKREEHLRGRFRGVAVSGSRKERLRDRAQVVVAGVKKEEHLRGRVQVVAENENVSDVRVHGHAPEVAEDDRVDHRCRARQVEWEGCPIRFVRMPHGTLVRRQQRGGGRYHRFRDWRQSPRRELSG